MVGKLVSNIVNWNITSSPPPAKIYCEEKKGKEKKKCKEKFMPSYELCLKCKHIILFTAYQAYLSVSYIF
jgi:hypothetical protein